MRELVDRLLAREHSRVRAYRPHLRRVIQLPVIWSEFTVYREFGRLYIGVGEALRAAGACGGVPTGTPANGALGHRVTITCGYMFVTSRRRPRRIGPCRGGGRRPDDRPRGRQLISIDTISDDLPLRAPARRPLDLHPDLPYLQEKRD